MTVDMQDKEVKIVHIDKIDFYNKNKNSPKESLYSEWVLEKDIVYIK